jgi:predicted ribosomally synthesized peptide with SipW-like signal peptide
MRPPLYHRQETGPAGLLGRIRTAEVAHSHALLISAPASIPAPAPRRGLHSPGRAAFAKLMVTMIVVAAIASLASGTFASFNAVTQNSANTFQTGTVLLSATQPNGGTACLSYGGGATITNNNVATCPPITFAGLATGTNPAAIQGAAKPSDAVHAHVTVQNVGTLNATNLLTYSTGTATCTTANNPNTAQHGGAADLCSAQLQFYVQEYNCSGFTPGCLVSACVFPADAANACTLSPSYPATLGTFTQHIAAGAGVTAPLVVSGGLTAGQTRYLDVVATLPATAGNTYQGMQAQFNLVFQVTA